MKLEENEYVKEVNNWGEIYRYIKKIKGWASSYFSFEAYSYNWF